MRKVIFVIIGMSLALTLMFYLLKLEFMSARDKISEPVGHLYVIGKDTLMVVDVSFGGDVYTMSNGQSVNYRLINGSNRVR